MSSVEDGTKSVIVRMHAEHNSLDFRFLNRGGQGNEGVHLGQIEQLKDAWARPGGNNPDAFAMAPDILTDKHARPVESI